MLLFWRMPTTWQNRENEINCFLKSILDKKQKRLIQTPGKTWTFANRHRRSPIRPRDGEGRSSIVLLEREDLPGGHVHHLHTAGGSNKLQPASIAPPSLMLATPTRNAVVIEGFWATETACTTVGNTTIIVAAYRWEAPTLKFQQTLEVEKPSIQKVASQRVWDGSATLMLADPTGMPQSLGKTGWLKLSTIIVATVAAVTIIAVAITAATLRWETPAALSASSRSREPPPRDFRTHWASEHSPAWESPSPT